MKIAVISDIHGFSLALESVLASIAEEGVDEIVAAGDLCEGGPDPRGVLKRLETERARSLQGNTDRDVSNGHRTSKSAQFTLDQIGVEGARVLRELPFEIRISGPGATSPDQDLLVVHANPFDQDRPLAPTLHEREVRDIIGDARFQVLAFGHIHIAYTHQIGEQTLVDVSAVGNPKDGDLRSKWGLITWDDAQRRWSSELRYVEYPIEETLSQIRASGMPKADDAIEKLLRASYS